MDTSQSNKAAAASAAASNDTSVAPIPMRVATPRRACRGRNSPAGIIEPVACNCMFMTLARVAACHKPVHASLITALSGAFRAAPECLRDGVVHEGELQLHVIGEFVQSALQDALDRLVEKGCAQLVQPFLRRVDAAQAVA